MAEINFVFCATRFKDVEMLYQLMISIRKNHKSFDYQLFTTKELLSILKFDIDKIKIIDNTKPSFLDKVYAIKHTKFNKFIYLDCDTYLLDDINDVWKIVNKYKVCVAHAPRRYTYDFPDVPHIIPEYNTGVIAIRRTMKINSMIQSWYMTYEHYLNNEINPPSKDQPFFRRSLYHAKINPFVLTNEYNCRFTMGVTVCNNVKILHGYSNNLHSVINNINDVDKYNSNKLSGEPDIRYIKYK